MCILLALSPFYNHYNLLIQLHLSTNLPKILGSSKIFPYEEFCSTQAYFVLSAVSHATSPMENETGVSIHVLIECIRLFLYIFSFRPFFLSTCVAYLEKKKSRNGHCYFYTYSLLFLRKEGERAIFAIGSIH